MSWQAYVDTQLVATGHVQDACMLGAADGAVWGMTSEFQPRYYEADTSDDQGNPPNSPSMRLLILRLVSQAALPVRHPPVCVLMVKNICGSEPEMKTERNMSKHRKAKLPYVWPQVDLVLSLRRPTNLKARFLQVRFLLLLH